MKRFILVFVGFVFFSMSGWANHSNFISNSNAHNFTNVTNTNFIFVENGVEFSVFKNGQFDFYLPHRGPQVSIGGRIDHFSFNTGFNYNPYVQYDSFGAVLQIENTPIFYDAYGRVQQIGNVFISYNRLGFVSRIGGLRLFYRGNNIWRQAGFINLSHRNFVWRPWHRYYALPAVEFSLISSQPYRQFYRPVRHIYYRPYRNNNRHFAFNRHSRSYRNTANTARSQRYAQSPRNRAERNLRSNIQRRNERINRTRQSQTASTGIRRASSASERTSRSISERGNKTLNDRSTQRSRVQSENIQNRRLRNEKAITKPRMTRSNRQMALGKQSREQASGKSARISEPRSKRLKATARPAAKKTNEVKSSTRRGTISRPSRNSKSSSVRGGRSSRNRS